MESSGMLNGDCKASSVCTQVTFSKPSMRKRAQKGRHRAQCKGLQTHFAFLPFFFFSHSPFSIRPVRRATSNYTPDESPRNGMLYFAYLCRFPSLKQSFRTHPLLQTYSTLEVACLLRKWSSWPSLFLTIWLHACQINLGCMMN